MATRRGFLAGLAGLGATLLLPPTIADAAESVSRRSWALDRTMLPPSLDGWQFLRRDPEHLGHFGVEYQIRHVGTGLTTYDGWDRIYTESYDYTDWKTTEDWARSVIPRLTEEWGIAPNTPTVHPSGDVRTISRPLPLEMVMAQPGPRPYVTHSTEPPRQFQRLPDGMLTQT
jgi:hypothetical protein